VLIDADGMVDSEISRGATGVRELMESKPEIGAPQAGQASLPRTASGA
jgi:hypothetical protein